MIRSILAILAGLAVIILTSFGIEAAANPMLMRMFPGTLPDEAAMSHNPPAMLFTFTYTFLCVVAGGYITARLAAHSVVRHDKAPLWGWITSMVVVIPASWFGGLICSRRMARGGTRSTASA